MKEQTRVFNEMTAVINDVADGADQKAAAEKITDLGQELKALKIRLADQEGIKEKNRHQVLDLTDFSEATAAYQEAREKLLRSGRNTAEIARALISHHNPAPMNGEGSSE